MIGKINILAGTTASGKTKYAVELAEQINAVIINCDSMQVYQEIPLLTAQPTEEEKQGIEHRLYGCISCGEEFNVGIWLELVIKEIKEVLALGKTPLLVGGTGLYIKSLVEGISELPTISQETKQQVAELQLVCTTPALYAKLLALDPLAESKINSGDTQRILRALAVVIETGTSIFTWQANAKVTHFFPREGFYLMWLKKPREIIYNNINQRFVEMIDLGVVEEVKKLYEQKSDQNLPRAHGLPEIIKYLKGELTLEQAIVIAQQNTRNYAKRQITFFTHQLKFDKVIER
jgi:tRNA dimethylallyltransferase